MTDNDGAIQPGGRFERIEATLARIETKLDSKVSHDEFQPVIRRLEALESGETPLSKVLLTQFEQLQKQVAELLLHGSANAQTAGQRVGALETDVAAVKTELAAQRELTNDRRSRDERGLRFRALIFTAIGAIAAALSVIALISGTTH